jgi:syntaxin 1B/2/3
MENYNEKTDQFLKEFFEELDDINDKMDQFKKIIGKIKQLHSDLFNLAIQSKKKALKQDLDTVMTQAKQKTNEISKSIDLLKKGTEERMKEKSLEKGKKEAELRLRETNQFQVVKRFQELLFEYQTVQADFKEKYTDKLKRSYKISHPDSTEEEIDDLLQNQQLDEDVYKKKVTLNKTQESTLDVLYEEAVETHKDIQILENSLIELQELFITMSNLVDLQDDLIDNISANVLNAGAYVEEAVVHIKTGKKAQEGGNWVLIIIIVVVVLVIIAGVIAAIVLLGGGGIGTFLGVYFGVVQK